MNGRTKILLMMTAVVSLAVLSSEVRLHVTRAAREPFSPCSWVHLSRGLSVSCWVSTFRGKVSPTRRRPTAPVTT